jgi:hypothetical protein
VTAARALHAQQKAMRVIGFLSDGSLGSQVTLTAAFREGLKQTGWVEGQNVTIEYRWAEDNYDRLPALAADLVRHPVGESVRRAGLRAGDGGADEPARARSAPRQGLRALAQRRGPVVVHVVQHVAHPPVELEDWPDDDRRSRLVFVTRGLGREPVARLFAGVAAIGGSRAPPPLDHRE